MGGRPTVLVSSMKISAFPWTGAVKSISWGIGLTTCSCPPGNSGAPGRCRGARGCLGFLGPPGALLLRRGGCQGALKNMISKRPKTKQYWLTQNLMGIGCKNLNLYPFHVSKRYDFIKLKHLIETVVCKRMFIIWSTSFDSFCIIQI